MPLTVEEVSPSLTLIIVRTSVKRLADRLLHMLAQHVVNCRAALHPELLNTQKADSSTQPLNIKKTNTA